MTGSILLSYIIRLPYLLTLFLATLLAGCNQQTEAGHYVPEFSSQPPGANYKRQIRVGIHPLHNPDLLFERYGPIVDVLNQKIGDYHFVLEASRNYQEFENKLRNHSLDFAMPNPYQTLAAINNGYLVFGKMADDEVFRGLVLVRKDSGIKKPRELRGQNISFPSPTALAATMQPQYELQQKGLAWGTYNALYVGSQESSIMNVLLGQTAAGATWPTPWVAFQSSFPERAEQLEVLLQTPPLINNSWIALQDLPPELIQQVGEVLFNLHTWPEGREILAQLPLQSFEAASNQDYARVQEFINEFSRSVREVEL